MNEATPTRAAANRRNALRSTGPRTPAGKARSSKNATRHGLLSREELLPDESAADFAAFRDRMLEALAPEGDLEELLADRVVSGAWRLRRFVRVEVAAFERSRYQWNTKEDHGLGYAFSSLAVNGDVFSKLSRYEAGLERSLFRALHELQRLQASRAGELVPPPVAVDIEVSGEAGA
jgi:hypothetical protein